MAEEKEDREYQPVVIDFPAKFILYCKKVAECLDKGIADEIIALLYQGESLGFSKLERAVRLARNDFESGRNKLRLKAWGNKSIFEFVSNIAEASNVLHEREIILEELGRWFRYEVNEWIVKTTV